MQVHSRLRAIRRAMRLGQEVIAKYLGISVSEISRLERNLRRMRMDQLEPWAAALGFRVEVVLYESQEPLDSESQTVMTAVAEGLPSMPSAAREALILQMAIWQR